MAKRKLKTFRTFTSFSKWTKEEQATYIETATKKILKNLNKLKKNLQMYGEISEEIYNLSPSELRDYGQSYATAVRGGEITTPSSKQAYRHFIEQLRKYSKTDISKLALTYAKRRLDSWLDTVKKNGSLAEIEYAQELIDSMSNKDIRGFTLSKYFLDTETWNYDLFSRETDEGVFSIQVLKLELYLQSNGVDTRKIYNRFVATDGAPVDTIRKSTRKGQKKGSK